jgi:hypothetical protein
MKFDEFLKRIGSIEACKLEDICIALDHRELEL